MFLGGMQGLLESSGMTLPIFCDIDRTSSELLSGKLN